MGLAIFDLDLTLIGADSDYQWGEFLIKKQLTDAKNYRQKREDFYNQYLAGTLHADDYYRFSLEFLTKHDKQDLLAWREEFIEDFIKPLVLPKSQALVENHRQRGHELLIITATNFFLTKPIAALFDIPNLIAPMPEQINHCYTGKILGIPPLGEGKVFHLQEWLKTHKHRLADTFFYSDSHNDLPLLKKVGHAVAVNPDNFLKQKAKENGWQILNTLEK